MRPLTACRALCTTLTVVALAVTGFVPVRAQSPAAPARVSFTSDPAEATVQISTETVDRILATPTSVELNQGTYIITFRADGHDPLEIELTVRSGEEKGLRAILLPTAPPPPSPEELGLSRRSLTRLRLETEADRLRERYYSLGEGFIVFPLSNGLMAFSVSGVDAPFAKEFIVAGAALTATSYILGKVFSNRRLTEVRAYNQVATAENDLANAENAEVDRLISEAYSRTLEQWQVESDGRGFVETVPFEEISPTP